MKKSWYKPWTWLNRKPSEAIALESFLEQTQSMKHLGLLTSVQQSMIESILKYRRLRVRDVMVSRQQIKAIKDNADYESMVAVIKKHRHSRYPVYHENLNQINGVFLAKDLITQVGSKSNPETLMQQKRPIIHVPDGMPLEFLLHEFKRTRSHMAIVIDEFSETLGLITIEDVIEQIIGDIHDEHDQKRLAEDYVQVIEKNHFRVNALMPVALFNNYFNTNFPDDYYDTFAGILAQEFGRIPNVNDKILLGHCQLRVLKASSRQIKEVEIQIIK